MSVNAVTHLNFRGDAREALTFYQSVFGGDLVMSTRVSTPKIRTTTRIRPRSRSIERTGAVSSAKGPSLIRTVSLTSRLRVVVIASPSRRALRPRRVDQPVGSDSLVGTSSLGAVRPGRSTAWSVDQNGNSPSQHPVTYLSAPTSEPITPGEGQRSTGNQPGARETGGPGAPPCGRPPQRPGSRHRRPAGAIEAR